MAKTKSDHVQTWMASVEQCKLTSTALQHGIKAFDAPGGSEALKQAEWDAVEHLREAYVLANRNEAMAWKNVMKLSDQTEIPGTEAPGPRNADPDSPREMRALPPSSRGLPQGEMGEGAEA